VLSQNCGCDQSNECCSQWGYCGSTREYCSSAEGCKQNCWKDTSGSSTGSTGSSSSSTGSSSTSGGDKGTSQKGDRPGGDIETVSASSIEECQSKCFARSDCKAWAFDTCQKQNCWLKDGSTKRNATVACRQTGAIKRSSSSSSGTTGSTGTSTSGSSTSGSSTSGGGGDGTQTSCQKEMTFRITSIYENSTPDLQYCFCGWQNDKHGITAGFPGFTTRDGDAYEFLTKYNRENPGNAFSGLMDKIKSALNTNNDISGYCDAWRKECKLEKFKQAEVAYVDVQYYSNSQQKAKQYGITSPLVRALFYDTNIMQGDGGSQYDLSGIAKWTQQQVGTPDSSGASQLNWARKFLERRSWVFQNSPDGGWEGTGYRIRSWDYILKNNDASMPGKSTKILENGGQPMTIQCTGDGF